MYRDLRAEVNAGRFRADLEYRLAVAVLAIPLSSEQRAAVVAAVPGEVTNDEMAWPEGDRHSSAKVRALDALRGYFSRQRGQIYITPDLPTYYPAELHFAPDLRRHARQAPNAGRSRSPWPPRWRARPGHELAADLDAAAVKRIVSP